MKRVQVTDHALVRWLERARGIEMEELRKTLAELAQPYVDLGVRHAEIDGVWAVFDGPVLKTVVPNRPKPAQISSNDKDRRNSIGFEPERPHWKMLKRKRRR